MKYVAFEVNTLKKVFYYYVIVLILILVFSSSKSIGILAFTLGTCLSCIKFLIMGKLSTNLVSSDKNFNGILFNIIYVLAIILSYGIVVLSVVKGLYFFVFFISGFVLINFVVFIDSILELIGFTKNNY